MSDKTLHEQIQEQMEAYLTEAERFDGKGIKGASASSRKALGGPFIPEASHRTSGAKPAPRAMSRISQESKASTLGLGRVSCIVLSVCPSPNS